MIKNKSKGGRPTKKTLTTVRKLEEAFALGCTPTEAALFANISRETLYEWMRSDKEFSDRMESLKLKPVLRARQSMYNELEKGNVRLAMWYLERKRPKEFSLHYGAKQTESDRLREELSPEDQKLINRALRFTKIAPPLRQS